MSDSMVVHHSTIRKKIKALENIGFRPLGAYQNSATGISWKKAYDDPGFRWSISNLVPDDKRYSLPAIVTMLGKTHLKDKYYYLCVLDTDSQTVYNRLNIPIRHLLDLSSWDWVTPKLSDLVRMFLKSIGVENGNYEESLLDVFKKSGYVTKTHKKCGYHIPWLDTKQRSCISSINCKTGNEFEIKTDNKLGLCTLPDSPHRNDPNFRYKAVGQTDRILVSDILYDLFVEMFQDCLISDKLDTHNDDDPAASGADNKDTNLESRIKTMISVFPFDIDTTIKIPIGIRHRTLLYIANSLISRHSKRVSHNELEKVFKDINQQLCKPKPSPDDEIEQIWKDAIEFQRKCDDNANSDGGNGNGRPQTDAASHNSKDSKNPDETVVLLKELYQKRELNTLFVDRHDTAFSAIMVDDHREVLPIKSSRFKRWICKRYFETHSQPIKSEALKQFCDLLEAQALFSNDVKDLQLRTAIENYGEGTIHMSDKYKTICYDLTNKTWQVVRISLNGWKVEDSTDVPIVFRRYSNQKAQGIPSKRYPDDTFDQFMNLINVKDASNKLLLKCYIIALFIPDIPKPILMLHGEQGSAKSTLQELIKRLVDPSNIINLTFPRDINELIQQLSHNYIAYYDNVSGIRDWISDQLCRAVTGSGFSKRELYSNDSDIIYNFKRCLGFNGINLAATKADLLDRGIIIQLDRISKENRCKVQDIINELESLKPELLGYIFDIIVDVLRAIANGGIKLDSKSRMADFEEYAEIISRCMGNKDGSFIDAYHKNQQLQTEAVIEGSPVAVAIIKFMELQNNGEWIGTATELMSDLTDKAYKDFRINTTSKSWPKVAHVLSRKINEIKSNLRDSGISIEHDKTPNGRTRIIKIRIIPSEASEASEGSNSRSNGVNSSDTIGTDDKIASEVASENNGQIHAQKQATDATDATDAIIQALKERGIHRIGRSDKFRCDYCSIREDIHFMKTHNCKGGKK